MNLKNMHINVLKKINPNLKIKKRFLGGMSNFTYLVEDYDNNKYVFRIPGKGSEIFSNYITESKNLAIIDSLDINSRTIYYDNNLGYKISESIYATPFNPTKEIKNIAKTLKTLHQSKNKLINNYNIIYRLRQYEIIHNNCMKDYYILKEFFLELYEQILKEHCKYPCHNDAQISNMLKSKNKIYLLDWEFAGQNDYIYDIASFGNNNFDDAILLLKEYINIPTNNDLIRLHGWRLGQCLQWYNVASYKFENNICSEFNIDFKEISKYYLKEATYHQKILINLLKNLNS